MAHSLKKWLLAAVVVCAAGLARADDKGEEAARVLAGLPGFDFSALSAPAKKELLDVFTDEFDYCGRPLTLLASLKKGDACAHTRRLAGLAGLLAKEGLPASDIIVELGRYNQGFLAARVHFKVDERMCRGASAKDAKVTLVEFADFECPFCNAARPVLEGFVKARDKVRLCYLPFPLSAHPHSTLTGQAALFARDHGKFWDMYDALFDNQQNLSEDLIKQLAQKLGLDAAAFGKAVAAANYVDELKASKDAGMAAGVDSTPTVYVNGRKLSLNLSMQTLGLACDDELDWQQGGGAWERP